MTVLAAVDKARARQMREQGLTLQAIGDELGVSRERVRQIVGPAQRVAQDCERCGGTLFGRGCLARYCSRTCANIASKERNQGPCADCGEPIAPTSIRCIECDLTRKENERRKRWTRIATLWAEGLPMEEIGPLVGRANKNSLSVEMARMRHAGWGLPYRRPGWKGDYIYPTGPRTPALTHRQANARVGQAVRSGQLSRPDCCERCDRRGHVDGHHFDYSKPLEVEWLCRSCHMAHHAQERRAA